MHRHDTELAGDHAASNLRTKHRHVHRHDVTLRQYGLPGAVAVGALHGFGAETGTQAVVLMTASNAEGIGATLTVLGAFVVGVVATTAGTAALASVGWMTVGGHQQAMRILTIAAAATSVLVGVTYLTGQSDLLPPLLTAHH
jgi:high-affinity nickel-transport protein